MIRAPLLTALLSVAAFAATPLSAQETSGTKDKVDWVHAVEAQDFFFWQRYAYRLTRKNEFDLDERFYQPNVIVNGSQSVPLPRLAPRRRTIAQTAWDNAAAYAFAHKSSVLVAVRHGAVEYEQWSAGHAPGTLESVHSFSKTLVALLTGIAIAERKIGSIDEPIGRYIAEWKDDPRGKITLRDLLQGTSGLEKVAFNLAPANKMLRLAEDRDVDAAALAFDRVADPGKTFSYNSVDTQIAGLVLQRATGEPYADYLSSRLWAPLGNGTATINIDELGRPRTFCCLRSLAEDWLRIGQLVLDKGTRNGKQIVPAAWLAEMAAPSKANPYFGLQMSIGRTDRAPVGNDRAALMVHPQHVPYGADGVVFLTGANYVNLWIVPARQLVILRLGDYDEDYDTPVIVNDILAGIR